MIDELKIMLAQLNPTVGALSGNAGLAREAYDTAAKAGADLLVFPELFISGYPPEDLVLKPAFVAACMAQVRELATQLEQRERAIQRRTSELVERERAFSSEKSSLESRETELNARI